jgi:membrane associated rhomboid family serine protease
MLRDEEKKMIRSLIIPLILVFLMWVVRIVESIGGYDFATLGIFPLRWQGLLGIVTTPFVHGDFSHLIANSVPFIILGSALFYFYKDMAFRILLFIWLFSGFWVWVAARPAFHIGASGIVYGLAAFILVSGIIRKHTGLMAMALVVVFLYGSLIWGIFPEFFPEKNISWEAHLFGMIAGIILAFYYRKEGPQRRIYDWEQEDDEEEETGEQGDKETGGQGGKETEREDAYWNITLTDEEIREIKHTFRNRS